MTTAGRVRWLLSRLSIVLLLSGCAGTSPPTHFYTLDSGPAPRPVGPGSSLALGLGPIVLPDTLDRPQIVTRNAPYSLELAEFHRWAGNLKEELGRLLATHLSSTLGTDRVFVAPWPRYRELDYQIRVEVRRFDGRLADTAELSGYWILLDAGGRKELALYAFSLAEPVESEDYAHLVAALSKLALRLGEQIAEQLRQLPGRAQR